jgi:hypothetical protein
VLSRGSTPRSMAPTPVTCHIGCHVGKVGATICYLDANDDGAEVRVHFLK